MSKVDTIWKSMYLGEALIWRKLLVSMQDDGAPVGLLIALRHPEWIETLIVQNGNTYEEGLTAAFDPRRAFWKESSATN